MKKELVIVLDFGGQYNQLVARVSGSVMYIVKFIHIRQILKKSKEMNPKGNHSHRRTKQLL